MLKHENVCPLRCIFRSAQHSCQISQDFFFPVSLHCTHIFSLHFIIFWCSGRVMKTTLEFGAASSSNYKKNHPYKQFLSLIPPNNLFTIFLRGFLVNCFMLTVGQPRTTSSIEAEEYVIGNHDNYYLYSSLP